MSKEIEAISGLRQREEAATIARFQRVFGNPDADRCMADLRQDFMLDLQVRPGPTDSMCPHALAFRSGVRAVIDRIFWWTAVAQSEARMTKPEKEDEDG
jgi:hypothetical protein